MSQSNLDCGSVASLEERKDNRVAKSHFLKSLLFHFSSKIRSVTLHHTDDAMIVVADSDVSLAEPQGWTS